MRSRLLARSLIAVALALTLTGSAAACGKTKPAATPTSAVPIDLIVMEFNIENGGTGISFGKVVEAIRMVHPDIVCVEEAQGNTARLAREAGLPYYSARLQVLSRYPIIDPPSGDWRYVWVEVRPGSIVAVANVHLPSDPYGPFYVRDGKPLAKVLALENSLRMPSLRPILTALAQMVAAKVPTFLAGDFNSPSHLDWTPAAVGTRPAIKYAVPWPESEAIAAAGFIDSFRSVHLDPVKDPGLTWWAARPKEPDYNPAKNDPQDRIDFIYSSGSARATAGQVVGEAGAAGVKLTVTPWPSDHRAVESTFRVTPAAPPNFIAVDRQGITAGERLPVWYASAGKANQRIEIVPAGEDPWSHRLDGKAFSRPPQGLVSVSFATADLAAGPYDVVLDDGKSAILSRSPFWVLAAGAKPQVGTERPSYRRGQPITVTWSAAPGNRWDWLGIYKAPGDPAVDSYVMYAYMKARVGGSAVFDKAAAEGPYGGTWPLPPGKYTVFMLLDDGYTPLAEGSFTVTK